MSDYAVSAFYRFMPLPDFAAMRGPLQSLCDSHEIKGILLLAPEGINGTLSGRSDALDRVMEKIRIRIGCDDLRENRSFAEQPPFLRMKVRLKAEIVTMGDTSVDPRARTGIEVEPEDWNALIDAPDVVVVDVRNGFECAIGSFTGATDPKTGSFGQFPDFVRRTLDPGRHKTVAMFCTGGIRCEKASSFMLGAGFETVYQLKGGILSYLDRIPAEESRWRGACFVFDQRVAVGHGVVPAGVAMCFGCRHPLSVADRASPDFVPGVSCPHCAEVRSADQTASARERQRQVEIALRRGGSHLGSQAQNAQGRKPLKASVSGAVSTREHAAPGDVHDGGRNGNR